MATRILMFMGPLEINPFKPFQGTGSFQSCISKFEMNFLASRIMFIALFYYYFKFLIPVELLSISQEIHPLR